MKPKKPLPPPNRYAILNPETGKRYYVYKQTEEGATDQIVHFLGSSKVLICTPVGQWDPVSCTIQNDPEPYLVFEGSVVARAQKA